MHVCSVPEETKKFISLNSFLQKGTLVISLFKTDFAIDLSKKNVMSLRSIILPPRLNYVFLLLERYSLWIRPEKINTLNDEKHLKNKRQIMDFLYISI